MKSDSQRFKLKIRPNGRSQFEALVTSDMCVSELKTIIGTYTQVPPSEQKLICQGKVLKDESTLSSNKLSEGFVVQMLTIPQDTLEAEVPEVSTGRVRERYRGLELNERYETIRQGIQTVNLMFNVLTTRNEEENIGFDNKERKFAVGQWVDVLDTVEQWLEAQVLEIATTSQGVLVYIHYSGWPAQWDEWIDSGSSRIQPFHSFTNQSITAPMHLPHPTVPIENDPAQNQSPYDPRLFLQQGGSILKQMKTMLEKYYNLSILHKHEKIGEKIEDLRSRLGLVQNEEAKEWVSDDESINNATLGYEEQESISSIDFSQPESHMTTEAELNLLTVQTAPLLDRSGRLLIDLATLIPNPNTPLMPSPAELSLLTTHQRGESGIHLYAFLSPGRRNN